MAKKTYLEIQTDELKEGVTRNFPLYIHLKDNDHHIMISPSGDGDVQRYSEKFIGKKITCFHYPEEFKSEVHNYLDPDSEDETGSTTSSFNILTEDAQKILGIIRENNQNPEAKKQLIEITSKILLDLSKFSTGEPDEVEEVVEKCREFTEEVVQAVIENVDNRSLYEKIIEIKGQMAANHSTSTSTFSVMFAISLGVTDAKELADISMAALLHDIGCIKLSFSLRRIPEFEIPEELQEEYRSHVSESIKLLEKQKININTRIATLISQHHERYDGSGFPNGLKAEEINPLARILSIADYFDEAMTGRLDGKKRGALEAVEFLNTIQNKRPDKPWFDPQKLSDLIKLFQ